MQYFKTVYEIGILLGAGEKSMP